MIGVADVAVFEFKEDGLVEVIYDHIQALFCEG